MTMIRKTISILLASATLMSLAGCGIIGKKSIPEEWYKDAIEYYRDAAQNGAANESTEFFISSDMRDPGSGTKFGYTLVDLDGDGAEELLIGIVDDDSHTKFTNVVVYHSDLGPYCLLSGGEGYYIYLCNDNCLREDSWYGSETKTQYMKYNHENNAFTIVEGKYLAKKVELTPF
ncbi:hypothetical protein SAMN02910456_02681 [Ruminococcaceae bacterium YRB3002]|nr:hypothetical protein SAMN02910456_02681 [Ruminococcaceae bacterium YRB3002]